MKSNYQKYYDAIKGKDFSSPISKYTSSLNDTKSKIGTIETTVNSSVWIEKGLEIIKNSVIPSFKEQQTQLENGITALTTAAGKISELESKLKELETACTAYDNAKEEDKATYQSKVNTIEGEVDSIISAINGISFEYSDSSSSFASTMANLKDSTSIEAKKKAFIGDVDDPTQYTEYTGNNLFGRHNELVLFDNTTGEIINDHGTIELKPGETRVITVKLPTDTGMIDQIRRTTADGDSVYRTGRVITARSDIDPDPNNVEWVRLGDGGDYHAPSDMSLLHNNSYDWIITATGEGTAKASQTCLWSSSMTGGRTLKGMINLNVVVKS